MGQHPPCFYCGFYRHPCAHPSEILWPRLKETQSVCKRHLSIEILKKYKYVSGTEIVQSDCSQVGGDRSQCGWLSFGDAECLEDDGNYTSFDTILKPLNYHFEVMIRYLIIYPIGEPSDEH